MSVAALCLCPGCGTQIGLSATPSEVFVEVGGSTMLNVVAVMDIGAPRPASSGLTLSSSNPGVASVSGQVITGVAEGSTVVTVSDGTFTTTATVTVVAAGTIPTSLVLSPASVDCTTESDPTQLSVFAVFSSGSSEDVTDSVAFSSSNSAVAVVTTEGSVVCVSPGTTTVTAEYLGESGSTAVTVGAVPPESVTVVPDSITCEVGQTESVMVLAVGAGGGATDASASATYTSGDNAVATASAGHVNCVAVGSTTITANVSGVLGTVAVEVVAVEAAPDELVALRFSSATLNCAVTGAPTFTLTAEFGDGHTEDVTHSDATAYRSDNSNIVLVLNNEPTCVQRGTTTLRADYGGLTASAIVVVQ